MKNLKFTITSEQLTEILKLHFQSVVHLKSTAIKYLDDINNYDIYKQEMNVADEYDNKLCDILNGIVEKQTIS
jgi:hypothetical protein